MFFEMPENSPWGKIQSCHELCDGVFMVTTAGHGGVMIRREIAPAILSRAARNYGFTDKGYICYEEDCRATIPLRELIGRKLIKTPTNYEDQEYVDILEHSIQQWFPEYWEVQQKSFHRAKDNER